MAYRQRLRGFAPGFNQQDLINLRDTVTFSLHVHRAVAVAHRRKPRHVWFIALPVIYALPAFFAETPGQHQLLLHQRRQKTALLPEGVEHRAGDREVNVLTDHVGQLQRPHREAAAFAQRSVNHLWRSDLLFQRAPGFGVEGSRHAVDDKARRRLAAHRLFSPVQRQLAQGVSHFRRGRQAAHHLHQLHHRRGVEEVQPCHTLGMRDLRRNGGDGNGRRVAGQ
ncbi:Uncharacterised protein [Enterobacter cancerogenus]|uniref:Uncharacterized protein n=1 Tax=Enterobacter cancerogenus TaxID=69218 RepID=A0A484ZDK3_9ENTR|nr:Uncharacterised protein [Enterobacter cancerogenus]